jgi:hypothetical protein
LTPTVVFQEFAYSGSAGHKSNFDYKVLILESRNFTCWAPRPKSLAPTASACRLLLPLARWLLAPGDAVDTAGRMRPVRRKSNNTAVERPCDLFVMVTLSGHVLHPFDSCVHRRTLFYGTKITTSPLSSRVIDNRQIFVPPRYNKDCQVSLRV